MFLSRFRVRGYKCLEDVELPLTPFHAIVGPNDCGKSCLLEAISALYGRLKTPPAQWFPAAASPRDWLTHGSKVPAIDLAGEWSQAVPPDGKPALAAGYGLSIVVPEIGASLAVMNQWVRPRAGNDPFGRLTRRAYAYPHGSGPATAEDRTAQAAFRDVVKEVLQPAPVYRLDPRRLAEPVQADREANNHLDADGYGLAALLQTIAAQHAERFAEIEAELCRLVPLYRSIVFQMEPRKSKQKLRSGKPLEANACALSFESCSGRSVPMREVSPGTLLLLALVTLARLPQTPSLLMIENPEQGIYSPLLADLIASLRHMTTWSADRPLTQVILTTHSHVVKSLFQPREATLLSRPDEQPDGPVAAHFLECCDSSPRSSVAKGREE